jgi:hypothetical protein
MARFLFIITVLIFTASVPLPAEALPAEIFGPFVKIDDNDILVNTGLTNVEDIASTVNSGVEKEIVFTIELFKVWDYWPDEFVVSKKVQRNIKYDNLRGQYTASTFEGTSQVRKHFRDFNTMKTWTFMVYKINLVNMKELDPGRYYVRVVTESKSKELPPVIGLLMLFIPEVEMSLAKESRTFDIGESK